LRTEDFLEHRNTSLINNRQAGRRRGRGSNNGGGNGGGGGGGQRQGGGGGGQRDTGNRIDSRARGNATQLYEKYKNLARDAQMQGDRVNIEYYLQFADHYFRVLSEQRTRMEESQPQHAPRPRLQQPFDINGDDDYADEGEPIRAGEQQGGDQVQANQQNGQRQDRDERPRYDSQRIENRQRDDRQRGDQRPNREERPARDDQPSNEARDEQPRENPQRDTPMREPRGEYRDAQPRAPRAPRTPVPVQAEGEAEPFLPMPAAMPANDQADAVEFAAASTEEKPRRRGRPPRDRSAEEAPVAAGADADRLPPSLGISAVPAPAATDGEPEEKPRRRRIRAATSEVQAG
jgi:hypothetical protein